jgi:branched-chain amino acid transport system ATP-binding protein
LLKIDHIDVTYGKCHALKDLSLDVKPGEIFAVIGANGAGKTTLISTIMGWRNCARGSIYLNDLDITHEPSHKRSKMGISIVPEGRGLFSELSVEQNIILGAYVKTDKKEVVNGIKRLYEQFPILKERRKQKSKTLSGGEQQMLAISRALISDPKILLLDEPLTGLMPKIVNETLQILSKIKHQSTILIAEQNARKALQVADRAAVLELGKIILQGKAQEIMNDPLVTKAYIGK